MNLKWISLKPKAIRLRKLGKSLGEIEKTLKIPRSTLSGWFKNIILSPEQKLRLKDDLNAALIRARAKAVIWHNLQKQARLKKAEEEAASALALINVRDKSVLELALALLYIGEGFKTNSGTGMGNSDPLILKFFITALVECYDFNINKIGCELHLRADQNVDITKKYWSTELNLPLTAFKSISIDKRTSKSPTYPSYHGVCIIRCGNIAMQRRLVFLAKKFCDKIINQRAVSSAGRASD